MSTSTSFDPVTAVIDILDDTTDSDWSATGAKPAIERQEDSTQNYKGNRRADAIYVYTSADGALDGLSGEWGQYEESERVAVDVWTDGTYNTDASERCQQLYRDARAIIDDFANDNEAATEFQRFRPVSSNDLRGEMIPESGDHARKILELRVRALRES